MTDAISRSVDAAISSVANSSTTINSVATPSFDSVPIQNIYSTATNLLTLILQYNYTSLITSAKSFNLTAQIDTLALEIPHALNSIPYTTPKITTAALLVIVPTLCVYLGVILSLSKPRTAADPNSDKDSPYFHPSDNDDVVGFILSARDWRGLAFASASSMGITQVLLAPLMAAGMLWLINYGMTRWSVDDINRAFNVYVLVFAPVATHANLLHIYLAVQRALGTSHRYRLSLARDLDAFPRGRVAHVEPETALSELGVSPRDDDDKRRWLRRLRSYTAQNLTVFEPTVFADSPNGFNYVFDLRNVVLVPVLAVVVFMFARLNPFLNAAYGAVDTNWLALDIVGINLAVFYSRMFVVPRFLYALVLLTGLFVYDVTMVFRTNLMMNAATKLNVPVKLLIPSLVDGKLSMAFIGLGDIVVPSAFARLCLEYDYAKYYANGEAFHYKRPVPRKFFWSAIVGYVLGLVATNVALHVYNVGQPALLYIVPSMVFTHLVTSWAQHDFKWWLYRGEFPRLTEEEEDDEDDDDYEEDEERAASEALFDEWVDRVELKILEEDGDTDMDEVVYVLESDDDDETFVIEGEEDEEEAESESDGDSEDEFDEDLALLARDRERLASAFYHDEEEGEGVEGEGEE